MEDSKTSSVTDASSSVVGKNPRTQRLHVAATTAVALSPKKLPGSRLLPSSVNSPPPPQPISVSNQPDISQYTVDQYLLSDEVYLQIFKFYVFKIFRY